MIGPPNVPPYWLRMRLLLADWKEKRLRLHSVVGVVFKARTMNGIGAALDLHIHGRSARQSLLSVEAVRYHVHRLNRVEPRHERGPHAHKYIRRSRAVDTEGYRRCGGPVDVGVHRASGVHQRNRRGYRRRE